MRITALVENQSKCETKKYWSFCSWYSYLITCTYGSRRSINYFFQINSIAKVYVQRKAFEPHFSKFLFWKVNIGIDSKFSNHSQIILVDGVNLDTRFSLSVLWRYHWNVIYTKYLLFIFTKKSCINATFFNLTLFLILL